MATRKKRAAVTPLAVHAPGPWLRSSSGSVMDRDGKVVRFTAKFQDVGASGESDRAPLNDKLAIAAPELADALEAVRSSAQCGCSLREVDSGHRGDCWLPHWLQVAAAALRAAGREVT